MTLSTDKERKPTQYVGTTIGFNWPAELKLRLGRWIEKRRNTSSDYAQGSTVYMSGFKTIADLKIRVGQWLDGRRNDTR